MPMTDMQKMLAIMAAQSAGGLLNQWGGGQPQPQINPMALMQYQQDSAQRKEQEEAREQLTSFLGGGPTGQMVSVTPDQARFPGPHAAPQPPTTEEISFPPGDLTSAHGMSLLNRAGYGDLPIQAKIAQQFGQPEGVSASDLVKVPDGTGGYKWQLASEAVGQQGYVKSDTLSPERFQQNKALRAAGATRVETNVGPTGIDYGDPEAGMAWMRNADGSIKLENGLPVAKPYPGGSVYRKQQEAAQAAALDAEATATAAARKQVTTDVVIEDIDRSLALMESAQFPVTGMGSLTSAIPGTPAHDMSKMLDSIKSNIGFDRLQQMREGSKTGGALGQVSERENVLLQAAYGSLEQSQSPEQFAFNMRRLRDIYMDTIHGPTWRDGAKAADFPEGTIATDQAGNQMIIKGGKWTPVD